jgi:hypothetical protein
MVQRYTVERSERDVWIIHIYSAEEAVDEGVPAANITPAAPHAMLASYAAVSSRLASNRAEMG